MFTGVIKHQDVWDGLKFSAGFLGLVTKERNTEKEVAENQDSVSVKIICTMCLLIMTKSGAIFHVTICSLPSHLHSIWEQHLRTSEHFYYVKW